MVKGSSDIFGFNTYTTDIFSESGVKFSGAQLGVLINLHRGLALTSFLEK